MGKRLEFTIDRIGEMDFLLEAGINQKMQEIIKDLMERPDEARPRLFVLKIAMKPKTEQGQLYKVEVAFDADSKLPSTRSRVHGLTPKGGEVALFFEPMSRDDPNQPAFPEVEDSHLEDRAAKSIKMPTAVSNG